MIQTRIIKRFRFFVRSRFSMYILNKWLRTLYVMNVRPRAPCIRTADNSVSWENWVSRLLYAGCWILDSDWLEGLETLSVKAALTVVPAQGRSQDYINALVRRWTSMLRVTAYTGSWKESGVSALMFVGKWDSCSTRANRRALWLNRRDDVIWRVSGQNLLKKKYKPLPILEFAWFFSHSCDHKTTKS